MTPRCAMCLLALGASVGASAQPQTPPDAPERAGAEPPAATESDGPKAARPLGWLSDPGEPPADLFEALVSGKVYLDNNLRVELADTTGRDSSAAVTNRLRLGYQTKPLHGFSGFVEMESVATPNADRYFVPATGDGSASRTVVADPPGTEVNQAFARFDAASLGDLDVSLDVKAGRQRIKLDDDRFIGNVGWRQFEQTYDSASVRSDLGVEGLSAFYAYVWGVQRIFGPDGPNPDSDSHLLRVSYRVAPELAVTPFAYLLDFEDDDPANSSDSYGVRLTGSLWADGEAQRDVTADYELTYARQTDAGSNPNEYEADFFAAQIRVSKDGLGHVLAGYQLLGSDGGDFAFRFPLGTNHKFQGFADNFLVTPASGLQDLYLGIGAELCWGIRAGVTYHEFWSDEGGDDLGEEIDLVASKQLNPNWSVLLKGALYDGDSGQPDTTRFWVQTTLSF
ncbi:MAG: hypothetical protein ACF8Q5_13650 [Phycisphaerales bacterium JB040]